jgi:hypothetical protein
MGLRNYKDKWVTVEEEKRIRTRNEYDPFRVETEHFEVATNLGRKEAWEYAQLLEDFYGQFFRVFIGYYDQVAGAQLLFNQATAKKKHRVYLFPTHEDYLTHVKAEHGNQKLLRESAGFYSHGERISRFFWSQNLEATFHTMYHEVTHQLLGETKETSSGGSQGNNWVIEGIAVYAETWEKVGNEWFPGRKTGINELATAKGHLASGSGWKLSEFVRIDNDTFHKEGRGLNYAISGALAHFFMHYDDELHKEGFVRFLSAFYAGKVRDESLVEYLDLPSGLSTSEKFELVEKQFLEYMKGLQTS